MFFFGMQIPRRFDFVSLFRSLRWWVYPLRKMVISMKGAYLGQLTEFDDVA